jgi:F-type H+-transporting ATPase subunit a
MVTGLWLRGMKFFNLFNPHGVPVLIFHFLVIIEIISYFTRFISLPVRLFANMVAGHALMKILLIFAWQLIFISGLFGLLVGTIGWILIIFITLLEVMIAVLQAYVFVFLALIYHSEVIE